MQKGWSLIFIDFKSTGSLKQTNCYKVMKHVNENKTEKKNQPLPTLLGGRKEKPQRQKGQPIIISHHQCKQYFIDQHLAEQMKDNGSNNLD